MTYRTGNHWGVTIVREAPQPTDGTIDLSRDQLVAVVVNGDAALADLIRVLLNADPRDCLACHPGIAEYVADGRLVLIGDARRCRETGAEPPGVCDAETRSWDHFTPEQADDYWIRCTLAGPHDEHKDENTGLTWRAESQS